MFFKTLIAVEEKLQSGASPDALFFRLAKRR